jgi:hypothetical protein
MFRYVEGEGEIMKTVISLLFFIFLALGSFSKAMDIENYTQEELDECGIIEKIVGMLQEKIDDFELKSKMRKFLKAKIIVLQALEESLRYKYTYKNKEEEEKNFCEKVISKFKNKAWIKGITWRVFFATPISYILFLIFHTTFGGDEGLEDSSEVSVYFTIAEFITKYLAYLVHEALWNRSKNVKKQLQTMHNALNTKLENTKTIEDLYNIFEQFQLPVIN